MNRTADTLYAALMMDNFNALTHGAIVDFGLDLKEEDDITELFGAYQLLVKKYEVNSNELHKCVGDGKALTALLKTYGFNIEVTTRWDMFNDN
jgi:hypothetical protein